MVYGTALALDLRKGYQISKNNIVDIIGNCVVIEYDNYFTIVSLNKKRIDANNNEKKYTRYNYHDGQISVCDLNNKWGILSLDGEEIIPPYYDDIEACDDVYIVRKNGMVGLLDLEGKAITPLIYDAIQPFEGNVTVFSRNLEEGLIDKLGNETSYGKYEHILSRFKDGYVLVINDRKEGVINDSGYEVIPPIYPSVDILGHGYFACSMYDEIREQSYGLFKNNKQILDFKYKNIRLINPDCFVARTMHDRYLLINSSGKTIKRLTQRPDILGPNIISYDRYLVNADGKHIIPKRHNGYYVYEHNLVVYRYKELYGMKKSNGDVVVNPQYDDFIIEQGVIRVKQGGKWGLLDLDGNVIAPLIYDEMSTLKNGYFVVSRNDRAGSGLLDISGNEILPPDYQFSYFEVNDNLILLNYHTGYCLIHRQSNKKHYIEGLNDIRLLNDHQIVVNNTILNVNEISFVYELSIIQGQNLIIKQFDTEEEMNQYLIQLKKETVERYDTVKEKREDLIKLFLELDKTQLYDILLDDNKKYKEQLGLDLINQILELKQEEENAINNQKEEKIKKLGSLLDSIDRDVKELQR